MSESWGNAASGAASGAMAGTAVMPGWGTLAGAVIGGASSLIGGSMANESNAKQAEANRNFQAQQAEINRIFTEQQAKNAMQFEGASADKMMDYQDKARASAQNYSTGAAEQQFLFNRAGVDQQQAFGRETMNTAMQYDTLMSNTQMQRRMADLKAAGLNPMLAYVQGGASSPSVSPASSSAATGGMASSPSSSGAMASGKMGSGFQPSGAQATMQNILTPAFASATQGAGVMLGLEQLAANIEKTRSETNLVNANAATAKHDPQLREAHTAQSHAQTGYLGSQAQLAESGILTQAVQRSLLSAETASALAQGEGRRLENDRFNSFGRSSVGDISHSIWRMGATGQRTIDTNGSRIREGVADFGRSLGGDEIIRALDQIRAYLSR